MLAHHPITGQPIRILRTETQISSDFKTLVWIQPTFQPSHRWRRWFCLATEPNAAQVCGVEHLFAIVLSPDSDLSAWAPILNAIQSTDCLVVAPSKLLSTLSFPSDRILCWEDMFEMYPYLGEPIQTNSPIEKVVVSIAHVLRMNRIVWSSHSDRESMPFELKSQVDAWAKQCDGVWNTIPSDSDDSCIPQTWLIQQYYKPSSTRRAREIYTCLLKNIESPWIDHILLLNEKEETGLPQSPKLHCSVLGHRLTYLDVFLASLHHVPKGSFVIFSNSDIWFNHTLTHLWRISLLERRMFLALLRWEDDPSGTPRIFGPRSDSQDTWIFARDSLDFLPTDADFGFPFGKSGCDNAISLIMMRKKFLIVNPAYSIQTFHLHTSNIRTYDPKDVLYRTHYLYIDPTHIQVCAIRTQIEKSLPGNVASVWANQPFGKSFLRPIYEIQDGDSKAFCSMFKGYVPSEKNLYTPTPNSAPLYYFQNVFVTAEGLLSNCKEVMVGNHPIWRKQWECVHQSSLTQSIHVPHLISIPWQPSQSFSKWVLQYLPIVLQIRDTLQKAGQTVPECLVPNQSEVGSFFTDCSWGESNTVVPMLDGMNYYADHVWAMPPTEESRLVSREDIERLRSLFRPIESTHTHPVIVFCVEDEDTETETETAVCTRYWAEEVANTILQKGWIVRYLSVHDSPIQRRRALCDASWMVGSGPALEWMWYLPSGATVLEYMSEPNDFNVHLAGACEVRYILSMVKPDVFGSSKQEALLDLGRAIKTFGFKEMIQEIRLRGSVLPTIVVPSGAGLTGMWNHCGDTFREMVDIWAERKYIQRTRSEGTGFCWWGGIGEILLYDRPTPRWWVDIPSYQMALFGNCALPGPANQLLRQSVWCFWPRSPRAIEDIADRLENVKSYESRSISSLFLGKVENGVQRKHRLAMDWSTSVELFSMPIDTTGAPYPYTQKEYVHKLCNARFGLCLPGFGPKCNREIEYFACGCVPIVTEGVDMKHYLVPPKEGVHYFTASTPEDVQRIVRTTSLETWTAMSLAGREWWQTFASAEGLFRLTWARIEQCRPYVQVGIPRSFPLA